MANKKVPEVKVGDTVSWFDGEGTALDAVVLQTGVTYETGERDEEGNPVTNTGLLVDVIGGAPDKGGFRSYCAYNPGTPGSWGEK